MLNNKTRVLVTGMSYTLTALASILNTSSVLGKLTKETKKQNFSYPSKLNNNLKKLNKVKKETLNPELMIKDLRHNESKVLKKILDSIMKNEDLIDVNEFTGWNKDYLVQLLQYRALELCSIITDHCEVLKGNPKLRAVYEQGYNLSVSLSYYANSYLIRLNSSEDKISMYPINPEGISAIKELDTLEARVDKFFLKNKTFTAIKK